MRKLCGLRQIGIVDGMNRDVTQHFQASVQRNVKKRNLLLQRHSSIESIGNLMKKITNNGKSVKFFSNSAIFFAGKLNELASNATFVNTLQLAKTTAFDYTNVSYFTEQSGRYLVLAEENELQL